MNYPKAFPTSEEYESEGMTLRDYFAAKALGAILSNEKNILAVALDTDSKHGRKGIAEDCYAMADAMLKAREETK